MKKILLPILALLTCAALAEPPQPLSELRKTLTAASQQKKLAFVILGRPSCGNCNATKALIKEGKIPVTSADYVMADLNIDDAKTQGEFMRKYGKQSFGNTLPFVVITDSHGKALESSGGYKSAEQWTALLTAARGKVTSAPGAAATPFSPFKTAPLR